MVEHDLVIHSGYKVEDKFGYKLDNKLGYMGRKDREDEADYFKVDYRSLRKNISFLNFSSGDVTDAASSVRCEDDCLLSCDWPARKLNCTCVGFSRGRAEGS